MARVCVVCDGKQSTIQKLNERIASELRSQSKTSLVHLCVYLTPECPLSKAPQLVGRALGFAARTRGAGVTVDVHVGDPDPVHDPPPQCEMVQPHEELPLGHVALRLDGRFTSQECASFVATLHGFPCNAEGRRFCFVADGPATHHLPLLHVRRLAHHATEERTRDPDRRVLRLEIGGNGIGVYNDCLCIPQDDQYWLRPLWHSDIELGEQWLNQLLAFLQHE